MRCAAGNRDKRQWRTCALRAGGGAAGFVRLSWLRGGGVSPVQMEYTPKCRALQPLELGRVQHQKRIPSALPLNHRLIYVNLLQRCTARPRPQHTSLLDVQLGPVQAHHPQVAAELRAHVIRAGIGLALRLQVHQHQLSVIILTAQQAIKAAGNAALYIAQSVFTRDGLIGLPNGMAQ